MNGIMNRLIEIAQELYSDRQSKMLTFGDKVCSERADKVRQDFAQLSFGNILLPTNYNFGGVDLYGDHIADAFLGDQTPGIAWVRGFRWGLEKFYYGVELHISYQEDVSEIIESTFHDCDETVELCVTAYNFEFAETGYEGSPVNDIELTSEPV